MKRKIEKLRQSAGALCLMIALGGIAAAQNPEFGGGRRQTSTLVGDEQSKRNATDDERNEFYRMTEAASAALRSNRAEEAKTVAETLLKRAEGLKDDWNYGNAVHFANLVLGQIALDHGETDEAKRLLLEAGKTPGSAQLNTFGPNMMLAGNLLKKGERAAVLQYFALCGKFWKDADGKLNQWKTAVANGETPDFGKNLLY